jgi:hypothetical protein
MDRAIGDGRWPVAGAADAEELLLRATPRPFGLGIAADDVQAVHDEWTARGYAVPEVTTGRPRDASPDSPPRWSFQDIPAELLPGIGCFALTYHARSKDEVSLVTLAPNTVYAVSGVTLVTTEPQARAACWRDLLAPGEPIRQSGPSLAVRIGPHRAVWITPEDYQSAYGLDWTPCPLPFGELGLLHLLATDLQAAKAMLEQSGRRVLGVAGSGDEEVLIGPDARDGFVFTIRQRPVEVWLRERIERTGESLRLA